MAETGGFREINAKAVRAIGAAAVHDSDGLCRPRAAVKLESYATQEVQNANR